MDDVKMYFLLREDREEGPYSLNDLRLMLKAGKVTKDTQYSFNDAPGWAPLSDMTNELEGRLPKPKPEAAQPPPPPPPPKVPRVDPLELHRGRMDSYLYAVRECSRYRELRGAILVIAGFGYCIAVLLIVFGIYGGAQLTSDTDFVRGLVLGGASIFLGALTVVITTAIKQALLLLVDIADTQLFANTDKK